MPGFVISRWIMACSREATSIELERERITFVEREPITSAPTVGRELGKRRSAQRFLVVPW
jgi:hypothetical protein